MVPAYYIDLGQKDVATGMYERFVFDEEGIPRYPYPSGLEYNVTFICHYALYRFSLFQKYGRREDEETFLATAAWVVRHGEENAGSFVFPYRFSVHGLKAPWTSALGQGRILSVFSRAYAHSGRDEFLSLAEKALTPFTLPVSEGGVASRFPDGRVGFEEYPFPRPNLVLNGFIAALAGLFDLAQIGGSARAQELFDAGVEALEANLPQYDLGYWSAYDLSGPVRRVASDDYHAYHVIQLRALYEMTSRETFRVYGLRWHSYRKGLRLHAMRSLSRVNTRLGRQG